MLDKCSGASVTIALIFAPVLQQMKFPGNQTSTFIEILKISRPCDGPSLAIWWIMALESLNRYQIFLDFQEIAQVQKGVENLAIFTEYLFIGSKTSPR